MLDDLRRARLADWGEVSIAVDRLAAAVERDDEDATRSALVPLSRASFEGKVRQRLAHSGSAPAVVGTKQTSALPVVGVVCAALLLVVGYLIGGGLVLAGTAVLAVFVFGVAIGRLAHDTSPAPGPDGSLGSRVVSRGGSR